MGWIRRTFRWVPRLATDLHGAVARCACPRAPAPIRPKGTGAKVTVERLRLRRVSMLPLLSGKVLVRKYLRVLISQ